MAAKVSRLDGEGNIIFVEEATADQCSVEVGFDAKGTLYCKSAKLYFQVGSDVTALGATAEKMLDEAFRVLKTVQP